MELIVIMKGLFVKQPWGYLLFNDVVKTDNGKKVRKNIEVRTYKTHFRGFVAILGTSINNNHYDLLSMIYNMPSKDVIKQQTHSVLGVAEIYDCKKFDEQSFYNLRDHHLNLLSWYNEKLHGFFLRNVRVINPINYKPYNIKGRVWINLPEELSHKVKTVFSTYYDFRNR
jgi:hypothetical protein